MLEAFSNHSKGECLDASNRFVSVLAVAHHS